MSTITSSKILFYLCLAFVAGIFFESFIEIPQIFLWVFLFIAILLILANLTLLIRSDKRGQGFIVLGFCILFFSLGILRHQVSEFNILNNELKKLNDSQESIVLTGTIAGEPDIRGAYQKLKIKIENPEGIVLITTNRYPEYQYLDKVKITGKLETPMETEDFNYKNYLLKDHIYSVMAFPKISALGGESDKINPNIAQKIYSKVLWIKGKLRQSIQNNFSPPESMVLEGTVLGDSGAISQDLKDKLNITGLRHIVAVSGAHIVILSTILMSFLLLLGFWRGQAFYFSIVLIWVYIILTGLPSSGIRAGVMGTIFLSAQKLGRQNASSRTIVMAGALMLFQNPLLLFYDVGFQLSFLASMGIIYLEPIIKNLINIFAKNKAKNITSMASMTFAAQIFTLPIMVYNFGNISFVSVLTNILVLPIVPGLMAFGFLASFLGVFLNFLGWIFSIPCWLFLAYFIKITDIFSAPWAMGTIKNVSWIWLAISYILIGLITRYFRKKIAAF